MTNLKNVLNRTKLQSLNIAIRLNSRGTFYSTSCNCADPHWLANELYESAMKLLFYAGEGMENFMDEGGINLSTLVINLEWRAFP